MVPHTISHVINPDIVYKPLTLLRSFSLEGVRTRYKPLWQVWGDVPELHQGFTVKYANDLLMILAPRYSNQKLVLQVLQHENLLLRVLKNEHLRYMHQKDLTRRHDVVGSLITQRGNACLKVILLPSRTLYGAEI